MIAASLEQNEYANFNFDYIFVTSNRGKEAIVEFKKEKTDTAAIAIINEWPPKSGTLKSFPEIDKAQWFTINEALEKINEAMCELILQLQIKVETRES